MVRNHHSGEEEQKLICKVSNNYRLNPTPTKHAFVRIHVEHSQDAIFVFQKLGLAKPPSIGHKDGEKLFFVPLHKCLVSMKHTPPACGNEGIISPVPGWLVSRNPNSCNIQFTTGYLIMRYLAKYVASIDEYNVIRITPPGKKDATDTFNVDGKLQLNTKITGNRIHQQRSRKKTSDRFPKEKQARGINIVETYMMQFQYDPILTNIEWIHVPTHPYEERASTERIVPLKKLFRTDAELEQYRSQKSALSLNNLIPSHLVRLHLGYKQWRMFTGNQLKKVIDDLQSPLTTDSVTLFGLRPPELRFVMTQVQYAKWFKRVPTTGDLTKQIETCQNGLHKSHLHLSEWIDATTARIYVRALAVPFVLEHLENCNIHHFHHNTATAKNCRKEMRLLFTLISQSIEFHRHGQVKSSRRTTYQLQQEQHKLASCFSRFVCDIDKVRLPITWFSSIRPTQPNRFLVHLLLSMGAFVEEYSLFDQPSLRHSFVHAGLLDENNVAQSANALAKKYITEQLASLPAGTSTFDRYAVAAYNTIHELFVNNEFYTTEMPSVLYCRLTTVTEKKILGYMQKRKATLVEHLLKKLKSPTNACLPNFEECMNATLEKPCSWDPTKLSRPLGQPLESFNEQQRLLLLCKNQIQHYKKGSLICTKGICVVGAGGVGKTTASLLNILYSICQGLNCSITAIISERAQELASEHLASLLSMPRANHLSPGQLAERCISSLYRKPEKLEYVRTLDLLLFDELGNASAEVMSVMDTVLRYVKDSNRPYGGLLIQSTMC